MFTKKDLVRLIIPLIIEQVLAATIGVADTFMVASVGEVAVSGVSLVDTVNILLLQVFAALATGGAIVAAQYLGRDDDDNANRAAKQLLVVTVLSAIVIMVLGLLGKSVILGVLFGAAEPAVMQNAQTYFWISTLSYPFIAIYNVGAALFRVQGNSRISMFAALLMNVLNISFNALFIYGMNMGVAGAAYGSLIARAGGALLLLFLLHNQNNRIHVEDLFLTRFDGTMIKRILRLGIPNGIENGIFHVGKILVQGLIATFGTVAITANAIGNSVMSIAQMPGAALGLAMITVVGQCVGAGDYDGAKRYMKGLTGAACLMMFLLNLGVIMVLQPLIGLFGLSEQTAAVTWQICLCCCILQMVFWSPSFALPNGLRAANDVKFTMITSVICMWAFRVGLSYVFGRWMGLGVLGVWLAMGVDWFARAITFLVRLHGNKWKNIRMT